MDAADEVEEGREAILKNLVTKPTKKSIRRDMITAGMIKVGGRVCPEGTWVGIKGQFGVFFFNLNYLFYFTTLYWFFHTLT